MSEITVKVFSYVNPVIINQVDANAPWYREKKVVHSFGETVIVLRNGYRVQYDIKCYWFRKIDERKIDRLIKALKENRHGTYQGWLHHYNRYDRAKKFISPQISIDHEL